MDFIEPCFGIGHNLSLICQMTSEDIKHQLIIIIRAGSKISAVSPPKTQKQTTKIPLHIVKFCHWNSTEAPLYRYYLTFRCRLSSSSSSSFFFFFFCECRLSNLVLILTPQEANKKVSALASPVACSQTCSVSRDGRVVCGWLPRPGQRHRMWSLKFALISVWNNALRYIVFSNDLASDLDQLVFAWP